MSEDQIKQLKVGFALNAAVTIYAVNKDKITIEEATEEALKLVDTIDFNVLMVTINDRI